MIFNFNEKEILFIELIRFVSFNVKKNYYAIGEINMLIDFD